MQAHSRATSAIGCIAPKPGRRMISMPNDATPTAVQRRIPTFSPSSGTESAVTISGEIARIACASASGSTVMVKMNSPISTISMSERRLSAR